MHLLILGATGPSGLTVTALALSRGHTCTLYVRNPGKLPDAIAHHERVTVIAGELSDAEGLEKSVASGAEVLVSCLGPPNITVANTAKNWGAAVTGKSRAADTPLAHGYKLLWPLLERYQFKRALVLSTASYVVPEDHFSLFWKTSGVFVQTVAGPSYKEINALSEVVAAQDHTRVGWTLFRVPVLTGGDWQQVDKKELPKAKADFSGGKEDGYTLKREALAGWLLDELESGQWVGKAPILSSNWSG